MASSWISAAAQQAAAAVAGLNNLDPATISVAILVGARKMTAIDAALPILVALSTKTITKVILCIFADGAGFALRVIPGLALVILLGRGHSYKRPELLRRGGMWGRTLD